MQLLDFDVQVCRNLRQNCLVLARSCNLERSGLLRLRVNVNQLTGLDAERRTIHAHTVNHNVTVYNHLTSLCNGASKARTQNQSVKTGLKVLNQVLTGLTLDTLCLKVCTAHLCLTNVVLSAQTLLFLQLGSVVRISLLAGTTMLTGAIRTALKVLFCLRGQCDAQSTGLTHSTAGAVIFSHNYLS